ncbi:hypothetical protein BS78_02G003000 [Paspalum vaginatum]|nr:hypothetical protein BS78_02G003000 [Paspalum vaginatum]
MAAKKIESGDEKKYGLKELRPQVVKLCKSLDGVEESGLAETEDLSRISDVLEKIIEKIEGRISSNPDDDGSKKQDDHDASNKEQDDDDGRKKEQDDDDRLLPLSKRKELAELVPHLKDALQQRMQPAGAAKRPAPPADKPKHLPSSVVAAATGCYPCKPRPSQQQQQEEEEEDKGAAAPLSLKLLHRLAQNVLEPEQYYEWTTSYVDEERLYGWDKKAGDVVESLIAPDDDGPMFRAAGIAGIHGSGKTALAQKVFVHDKAKDNFAIRLWVCVGPPDSEDRFNLLYRMLDNLGLDTGKVEDDIVAKSNVVRQATEEEVKRMKEKGGAEVEELRKKAKEEMVKKKKTTADDAQPQADTPKAKEEEDEEERIFNQLLEEKALQDSDAVQRSKIGVLLYILHVTLSKTSYLIVFDDIRVYGDDGWYSNLTLPPPPEGEWGDRLAYGLPKWTKHKGAVLVTCRKEDDAKAMVRTGRVFHPPRLEGDGAWKLFTREYRQAKKDAAATDEKRQHAEKEEDDVLLKDLRQIQEEIVKKCLGLPVAIIEAARGFALLDPLPTKDVHVPAGGDKNEHAPKDEAAGAGAAVAGNKPTTREDHQTSDKDRDEEEDAAAAADASDDGN